MPDGKGGRKLNYDEPMSEDGEAELRAVVNGTSRYANGALRQQAQNQQASEEIPDEARIRIPDPAQDAQWHSGYRQMQERQLINDINNLIADREIDDALATDYGVAGRKPVYEPGGVQAAVEPRVPGYADGLRMEALNESPRGGIWDAMLDTGRERRRQQEIDKVARMQPF